MKFYMGTHMPSWMKSVEVPLFISRRRLSKYKTLPKAASDWCLDSGGFSELSMFGEWRTSVNEYVDDIQRFESIGKLQWSAPQDWMCEPWITAKTGKTVEYHIQKTVENYLELVSKGCNVIPVLQGWEMPDYERCAEVYAINGIDLTKATTVGLGSVCRRQATSEIGEITKWGFNNGWKLHGFGVKSEGIKRYGQYLHSADSLAWSFSGRYIHDGLCGKPSCANCLHYALSWRENVLSASITTA